MKVTFRIQEHGKEGRQVAVKLTGTRIIVGRGVGALRVQDGLCSREHCAIYFSEDGELILEDLSSRNGTFLNGERIVTRKLNPGDELKLGRTRVWVLSIGYGEGLAAGNDTEGAAIGDTQSSHPLIARGSEALFSCVLPALQGRLKHFKA